MRLKQELKPDYFLLENVRMAKEHENVITRYMGIEPIFINSAAVSAQNRQRLYWTNIFNEPAGLFSEPKCMIPQPKDRGILLKDILESEVLEKYYLSDKMIKVITEHGAINHIENDKSKCLLANYNKMGGRDQQYIVASIGRDAILAQKRTEYGKAIRKEYEAGKIETQRKNIQQLEPRTDGKSNCLTSVQKDNLVITHNLQPRNGKGQGGKGHLSKTDQKSYCLDTGNGQAVEFSKKIRRLTPRECLRLQTVPEQIIDKMLNSGISDTQIYRMAGNGWTIEVIKHIFSYL